MPVASPAKSRTFTVASNRTKDYTFPMSGSEPAGDHGLPPTAALPASHQPAADEGRFLPGTVLAQRYRIISLLGRGGMGEVYRATDLLLEQPVALKFLPIPASRNEAALARFRNEVRVARQVSHPNVCRVYDIGEADGLVFLSMEFVDGEDLASLLRRIGHLPEDKAVDVVRKLCEGLAAAHDKGVIHRDLKPANIMLDGQGQVRVMDFGLAVLAETALDPCSGTPAYLAPEQRAGREATSRSDIYALGIVVHEIYTGRRPDEKSSTKLGLAPAISKTIERCLDEDPRKRPASARTVAASLPGGDPLTAALIAGETPSPQTVANAGPAEGMSVGLASICLAAITFCLAASLYLSPARSVLDSLPASESPEVLAGQARDYIRSFGYLSQARDSAMGWEQNEVLLRQIWPNRTKPGVADSLAAAQPPAMTLWYRQHPRGMTPMRGLGVTRLDPPFLNDSLEVVLDPRGRLVEFHAAPPLRKAHEPGLEPDWSRLFTAAGLDISKFTRTRPEFVPRTAYDRREAWRGFYPGATGTAVHVEAAEYEGKVSSFRVLTPDALSSLQYNTRYLPPFVLVFLVILPAFAMLAASRNVRRGRADQKGALRLSLFCGASALIRGLLLSHYTAAMAGVGIFKALRDASLTAVYMVILYLALEPYVRRRMPRTLISWNRILEGGWRNPLVGSDLLSGLVVFGVGETCMGLLRLLNPQLPEMPVSAIDWLGATLDHFQYALGGCFSFLLMLATARFVFRRTWIAAVVLTLALALAFSGGSLGPKFAGSCIWFALLLFLLARFGLVSAFGFMFASELYLKMPLTLEFSRWYAWQGVCTVLLLFALGLIAFWINLGGRPLWREEDLARRGSTATHGPRMCGLHATLKRR